MPVYYFGTTTIEDGLRFTDSSGDLAGLGNLFLFYSNDPNGKVADTGLPGNFLIDGPGGPPVTADTSGDFTYGPPTQLYNEIGNGPHTTPEPGSIALFGGLATAGIAAVRRRRRVSLSRGNPAR